MQKYIVQVNVGCKDKDGLVTEIQTPEFRVNAESREEAGRLALIQAEEILKTHEGCATVDGIVSVHEAEKELQLFYVDYVDMPVVDYCDESRDSKLRYPVLAEDLNEAKEIASQTINQYKFDSQLPTYIYQVLPAITSA